MIQVCTHSYSSDIADVVAMSSEIGCMSFFTSRGSCGQREPNYASVSKTSRLVQNCHTTDQLDDLDEHPVV
jgi:hypothetical protein